jgi:hypothetical protein
MLKTHLWSWEPWLEIIVHGEIQNLWEFSEHCEELHAPTFIALIGQLLIIVNKTGSAGVFITPFSQIWLWWLLSVFCLYFYPVPSSPGWNVLCFGVLMVTEQCDQVFWKDKVKMEAKVLKHLPQIGEPNIFISKLI